MVRQRLLASTLQRAAGRKICLLISAEAVVLGFIAAVVRKFSTFIHRSGGSFVRVGIVVLCVQGSAPALQRIGCYKAKPQGNTVCSGPANRYLVAAHLRSLEGLLFRP